MPRTKRHGPGKGGRIDSRTGKPLTSSENRRLQKQLKRAKEARKNGLPPPPATFAAGNPSQPAAVQRNMLAIYPFDAGEDRILLIGEGDFSFAHSLLVNHLCTDLTATTNDSQATFEDKYSPQGREHVAALVEGQQNVLYDIDATDLLNAKAIKKLLTVERDGKERTGWDVVMFNFPHVGGLSTDVNRQVRANQELLVKFFGECQKGVLSERGTVVVTLFEGPPYSLWNVKDLARHEGLKCERSFRFYANGYEGYKHVRTLGNLDGDGGWKGEERDSRSFVFSKKGPTPQEAKKKKKKKGGDDGDD